MGKGYNDRERRLVETAVGDLEADLEFLMRAVRKVEAIREDLGKVGPVIADQVEEAMLGGGRGWTRRGPRPSAEPVRKLFKFERDLAKQIKALKDQLQETRRELRLSPENIQKVVEVALELAGQPPLDRGEGPGPLARSEPEGVPGVPSAGPFRELGAVCRGPGAPVHGADPAVRLRPRLGQGPGGCGAGPSEPPAGADEPAAAAGGDLVAGGPEKRLHRMTARMVPDSALQHIAVVAHARLVVIGGDSQRLHEEIITAGGQFREGRFFRFGASRRCRMPWLRPPTKSPPRR